MRMRVKIVSCIQPYNCTDIYQLTHTNIKELQSIAKLIILSKKNSNFNECDNYFNDELWCYKTNQLQLLVDGDI